MPYIEHEHARSANKSGFFLHLLVALLIGVMLGFGFGYYYGSEKEASPGTVVRNTEIMSFEECVRAGYPVMDSYPEQCAVPGGQTFTRQLDDEEEAVFCTMDAKECPDGSYVGRIPPDCEFDACPGEQGAGSGEEGASHEQAEVVGFGFIRDFIAVSSPGMNDTSIGRAYNALSEQAKASVAIATIARDLEAFVGAEGVSVQGASVEDLEIISETSAVLTVGLNYADGRVLKNIHLLVEEGVWKVDRVTEVD